MKHMRQSHILVSTLVSCLVMLTGLSAASAESVSAEKMQRMDSREISLQRCLIELKVPNIYDARVDAAGKRVLFTDLKATPNVTFSAPMDKAPTASNSLDLGKFMKASALNRLRTEITEREKEVVPSAQPNLLQKLMGVKPKVQFISQVAQFTGVECTGFLNSIGKAKIAKEFQSYVAGFRASMNSVKSQPVQSKSLAAFLMASKSSVARR
jgi:hypothetical protein